MSGTGANDELINALKVLIIEECDKDIEADELDTDEMLIGGPLELDSLDALQICMSVMDNYGVRIEGGPEARAALQSVRTLAETIAAETSA